MRPYKDTISKKSRYGYNLYTSHALGRYGRVYITAEYWSLNSDGDLINSNHSIQHDIPSRTGLIDNEGYKELFKNAIKRGSVIHNHQFRKRTNSSWTYKLISHHVVYKSTRPISFRHNDRTGKNYVKENGRIKAFEETGSSHKNRAYVFEKEKEYAHKEKVRKATDKDYFLKKEMRLKEQLTTHRKRFAEYHRARKKRPHKQLFL